MSLVKTIDKGDKVIKLFSHQLLGGEKVSIGGKTYWMMVEKKKVEVKRHNEDGFVSNIDFSQAGFRGGAFNIAFNSCFSFA